MNKPKSKNQKTLDFVAALEYMETKYGINKYDKLDELTSIAYLFGFSTRSYFDNLFYAGYSG